MKFSIGNFELFSGDGERMRERATEMLAVQYIMENKKI